MTVYDRSLIMFRQALVRRIDFALFAGFSIFLLPAPGKTGALESAAL
jgi:hypothetical protein